MKTTLQKVISKAVNKGLPKQAAITVVSEDTATASATIRTNMGSKTTDYTSTMKIVTKPTAKERWLGSLP